MIDPGLTAAAITGGVAIIGAAFCLGKYAGRISPINEARKVLSNKVDDLAQVVTRLDRTNGILAAQVKAINETLNNGIVNRINGCIEAQGRMDERIKDLEGK